MRSYALVLQVVRIFPEVLRSAMDTVDNGQWEAAMSLGMEVIDKRRKRSSFHKRFRIAIPPLSNVLLGMIKGSSLVAMISLPIRHFPKCENCRWTWSKTI